jgi:hypothetical protein
MKNNVIVPHKWIQDVFKLTDEMMSLLHKFGAGSTPKDRGDFINVCYQLGGCVEQMQQSDLHYEK